MIAALAMLVATGAAAVLGIAALLAQPVLRQRGQPTRGAWAAAMALSIAVPAAAVALVRNTTTADDPRVPAALVPALRIGAIAAREAHARRWTTSLDRALLVAWGSASLLLTARLAVAAVALSRRRRAWRPAVVDGVDVLISDDVGPALAGVRAPRIVLPAWVLDFDAPLRARVLRHETEHARAGDLRLALASTLAVVLAPWNLALWWQRHRLRQALEIDCDARVLRAHPGAERYGLLLLAIAQRRTAAGLTAAPTLAFTTSDLDRRIAAMRPSSLRHPVLTAAASVALAGAGLALALVTPATAQPPADTARNARPFFEFKVDQPAAPLPGNHGPIYPPELKAAGREGEVLAQFVVDTNGTVLPGSLKVLRSSDPAFTAAVASALPTFRFSPARAKGRAVRQLQTQPFQFRLGKP